MESSTPFWRALRRSSPEAGFTLIEVMIVCVIVAVLAAIALPSYTDFVRRGKIVEATSGLSEARQRMEQYFLDNRTYTGGCAGAVAAVKGLRAFKLSCPSESATAYTLQAAGVAAEGMGGFTYSIDEAANKATTAVPAGWTKSATCWTTRKDGTCS